MLAEPKPTGRPRHLQPAATRRSAAWVRGFGGSGADTFCSRLNRDMLRREVIRTPLRSLEPLVMSSPSNPPPLGDRMNPDSGMSTDLNPHSVLGRSDPETIRRTHLPEEAYSKAVGILNFFFATLCLAWATFLIAFAIRHGIGEISAPWALQPGWISIQVISSVMAVLAIFAGYGFTRLRWWALRVEAIFFVCLLIWAFLTFTHPPHEISLLDLLSGICFLLALTTPLINLWDVRNSVIFDREYQRVIDRTRQIRTRPKLPLELKVASVFFMTIYLISSYFNDKPKHQPVHPAGATQGSLHGSDPRIDRA
jgi:hypothetical protein